MISEKGIKLLISEALFFYVSIVDRSEKVERFLGFLSWKSMFAGLDFMPKKPTSSDRKPWILQ